MNHDSYPDEYLRDILLRSATIAIIGASPDPKRPSHTVAAYLIAAGYRVIPVNPRADGRTIHGEPVRSSLDGIREAVDMVDVFRDSSAAAGIVDEVLRFNADARTGRVRTIWMQLGVRDDVAAARAEAAGIDVVMNRCPKIEHDRLRIGRDYRGE